MGGPGDDRGTADNPAGLTTAFPCWGPRPGWLAWPRVADSDTNPAAGATDAVGAVTPEVVDALQTPAPGNDGSVDGEQVSRPTKLIRIASMVRALLDEARLAQLDDAGRRHLKEIHER